VPSDTRARRYLDFRSRRRRPTRVREARGDEAFRGWGVLGEGGDEFGDGSAGAEVCADVAVEVSGLRGEE